MPSGRSTASGAHPSGSSSGKSKQGIIDRSKKPASRDIWKGKVKRMEFEMPPSLRLSLSLAPQATLTLSSPLQGEENREPHSRFLAASAAAAPVQLLLVCASDEGRSREKTMDEGKTALRAGTMDEKDSTKVRDVYAASWAAALIQ